MSICRLRSSLSYIQGGHITRVLAPMLVLHEWKSFLDEHADHKPWPIALPEARLPPDEGSSQHAKFVERHPLKFHQMNPELFRVPEQLIWYPALMGTKMIRWNLMKRRSLMTSRPPLNQRSLLQSVVAD